MDLAIIKHGAVRNIQEVKEVLHDRKTLAETGQVGGTYVRAAIANVPKNLSTPTIEDIRVDTFVLEGKDAYEESGSFTTLRKDLALLRDISALTVEKAHEYARNLKMLFGFSGAPVTNHDFMMRNSVESFIQDEERGLFFMPNVKAFSNDGRNAYLLDLPNMMNGAFPEVKSRYKFENGLGQERKQWYSKDPIQARDEKTASVKVVNDAVAHVRYQAANYSQGASLFHLVMSTGTNLGIGYNKQDDELGNFEQTINTEAGHIAFADLLEQGVESPLVLRWKKLENPSFETIMAGGNSASPERGLAGLVRDLHAHVNDKDVEFTGQFVDRANDGHYAAAINLATGDTYITDEEVKSSSLIKDDVKGDMNQAIEVAAINGDPLAKVLIAIWSRDLADVLNSLAAKTKQEQGIAAETKFNLSVNGSLAYGILDNPGQELDFAKTILTMNLNQQDFITDLDHEIAISRPAAEMDGLVEQAYKFAVAAVQAA